MRVLYILSTSLVVLGLITNHYVPKPINTNQGLILGTFNAPSTSPALLSSPSPSPLKKIVKPTSLPKISSKPITKLNSVNAMLDALNNYRTHHGKSILSWDIKLASYAQSRADSQKNAGTLDQHAGFKDFISNQNGFAVLGFNSLGENASAGYTFIPSDLIAKAYGSEPLHDNNQLDSKWSSVGIGVSALYTDFVFGGAKR